MTKQVPYRVMQKIEDVEIRQYPELIFAVVEQSTDDAGFNLLFQYINGENNIQRKIAMTAPVITSEKIEMTVPVISRKNYMAFALPDSYTKETAPLPINPEVHIKIQPKKTMAVFQFGGRAVGTRIQKYIQQLMTTLKKNAIQIKGQPILMRYNSPFTPGFLRRNEVAVEINDWKKHEEIDVMKNENI